MTVNRRIVLGFSVVISIALILGGMGAWSMRTAKTNSELLAHEYVPEVKTAMDLRGAANRLMYQMRGYGMTEEQRYYEAAEQENSTLEKHMAEATDLADRAIHLKALKGQIQEMREAEETYKQLMAQTKTTVTSMAALRSQLDESAASYMQNCTEFLKGQNAAFERDLEERRKKVKIVTDIANVGSQVRTCEFKAQATNDMALMQQAIEHLDDVPKHTSQLRPITRDDEDIQRIDHTEAAAKRYASNMGAYIQTSQELVSVRKNMDAAARTYVENCTAFLAGQNDKMRQEFEQTGANLEERLQKIALVHQIIDTGNAARLANFKGQLQKDPAILQEAISTLKGIGEIMASLRQITRETVDLKRLDETEAATNAYVKTMENYLEKCRKLNQERSAMEEAAGRLMENCTAFLEGQQNKLVRDMRERYEKITLVNDVVDLGNETRIKAFKSQALRAPQLMQEALQNFPKLDEKYEALRKITRLDVDLQRIDGTEAAGDRYGQVLTTLMTEWSQLQGLAEAREQAGVKVIEACKTTAGAGMQHTDEIAQHAAKSLSTSSTVMLIGLALGTVLAVVASLWITRSITGPLNRIIAGLTEGSEQVASASGQVSAASQSLAEGATEQAAGLEETSSSLEEMSSMTKQNADNAQQANALAAEACRAADAGADSMGRMNRAIEDIQKSSDETAKIIKVIDEIAFQTNLLALNAAVEAARAGEAGKGFAVVAEEVRNLAMRSAEAAKNTASMIEESVKNSGSGVEIASEVGKSLDEIVQRIGKTTDLVSEIAAASQEQAQGIDQVNTAVTQMDKVTQQNAANAEESASASEELSSQAESMNSIVAELVSLVGGAAQRKQSTRSARPARAKSLSASDRVYHQIAGQAEKAPRATAASAKQSIPLTDSEELQDFNT